MSESQTTTTTATDLQGADPAMLLSLLANKLGKSRKHSLDSSTGTASRRNSMPLKKRHKSEGSSFSATSSSTGLLGLSSVLSPQPPPPKVNSSFFSSGSLSSLGNLGALKSPQPPSKANSAFLSSSVLGNLGALNATSLAATSPTLAGIRSASGISASSLASLSALLGKQSSSGSQDLATRLDAFREAQRRSRLSRELLARATGRSSASSTSTSTANATAASFARTSKPTPSLAAALGAAALGLTPSTLNRVHSLGALGAAAAVGKSSCSKSSGAAASASAFGGTGSNSTVGQAMTSW